MCYSAGDILTHAPRRPERCGICCSQLSAVHRRPEQAHRPTTHRTAPQQYRRRRIQSKRAKSTQEPPAECCEDDKYRADFIRHAKTCADTNKVDAVAFRQLNVDDSVLRSAGLLGNARRAMTKNNISRRSVFSFVGVGDSIKAYVRSLNYDDDGPTSEWIGWKSDDCSQGVQALIGEGTIKRLGPVRDWKGRGRAPIAFEVS